jgi:glycerol-3-phosphate dehydrogenase
LRHEVDILIVGGGINGCGIARDAAGRGFSVLLCEMGDLASATSSWSSKLIHGGLRYLEYYEFRLVREALMEREVLWAIAPHIINPLRLVLPYRKGLRPAWMLRMGLFLYDHIGGRKKLPATRVLDLTRHETGKPLKAGVFRKGFEYSDCTVDDARLVVLNARDAADRGADIRTRTKVVRASRAADRWAVTLRDELTGREDVVTARAVVNAAGPWVADVLTGQLGVASRANTRLVQGSHIVVRKLYEHDRAYILQNPDGRIFFVIPYQNDFTLIGTTDRDYKGDPAKVAATAEEIDYLCKAASENFARPVTPQDVVWSYSGVRPLYDDGASEAKAATRDYVLELDGGGTTPAVLSVFGGKITTYRRLAEEALDRLLPHVPGKPAARKRWTAQAALPGGDVATDGISGLEGDLIRAYPFLTPAHAARLCHAYGTRAKLVLGGAKTAADLGFDFGATLTEAEVRYLVEQEWAQTAEDIIWRRSKLGLRMSEQGVGTLAAFLLSRMGHNSAAQRTGSAS